MEWLKYSVVSLDVLFCTELSGDSSPNIFTVPNPSIPNPPIPNGKRCYHCIGQSCLNIMDCSGGQDRCIKGTGENLKKKKIKVIIFIFSSLVGLIFEHLIQFTYTNGQLRQWFLCYFHSQLNFCFLSFLKRISMVRHFL